MPQDQRHGGQPEGENKGGKLPELTAQAGVEFRAQLLKIGVDLTTQLLEALVQVVEAFGDLFVRLFQPDHADVQRVGSHHSLIIVSFFHTAPLPL